MINPQKQVSINGACVALHKGSFAVLQDPLKPGVCKSSRVSTVTLGLELLHRLPHGLLGLHLELGDVLLHRLVERLLGDLPGAHLLPLIAKRFKIMGIRVRRKINLNTP